MASPKVTDVLRKAKYFNYKEKAYLMHLLLSLVPNNRKNREHTTRMDLMGAAPNLLDGQDAQEWVSRNRQESDREIPKWAKARHACNISCTYDSEGDVLYINLNKSRSATDSRLLDDDMVLRCRGEKIIGITILNASKR